VIVALIVSVFAAQPLTPTSGAADSSKGDAAQKPRGLGLLHWKHRSAEERADKRATMQAQRAEYHKQIVDLSAIVRDLKQKITRMPAGDLKANLLSDVMKLAQTISKLQKAREVHKNRVQGRD